MLFRSNASRPGRSTTDPPKATTVVPAGIGAVAKTPEPFAPAGRASAQPMSQEPGTDRQTNRVTSETLYEVVGGQPFFDALVARFYERVEADAVLRPMYPEDLEPGKRALAMFLAQYWGGPPDYSREKGHPRLRMRHMPFVIDDAARDAWLAAMLEAVESAEIDDDVRTALVDYFTMAATAMINAPGGGAMMPG